MKSSILWVFVLVLVTDLALAMKAVCEIKADTGIGNITGTVYLFQENSTSPTVINGTLKGAAPGLHGFHIHEKEELGNNCTDAGAHYNPTQKDHGNIADSTRHFGDLGNVLSDDSKIIFVNITDKIVSLYGTVTALNKSIVLHQHEDDLGKGGQTDSLTTGHAGLRLGCCKIVEDEEEGHEGGHEGGHGGHGGHGGKGGSTGLRSALLMTLLPSLMVASLKLM